MLLKCCSVSIQRYHTITNPYRSSSAKALRWLFRDVQRSVPGCPREVKRMTFAAAAKIQFRSKTAHSVGPRLNRILGLLRRPCQLVLFDLILLGRRAPRRVIPTARGRLTDVFYDCVIQEGPGSIIGGPRTSEARTLTLFASAGRFSTPVAYSPPERHLSEQVATHPQSRHLCLAEAKYRFRVQERKARLEGR